MGTAASVALANAEASADIDTSTTDERRLRTARLIVNDLALFFQGDTDWVRMKAHFEEEHRRLFFNFDADIDATFSSQIESSQDALKWYSAFRDFQQTAVPMLEKYVQEQLQMPFAEVVSCLGMYYRTAPDNQHLANVWHALQELDSFEAFVRRLHGLSRDRLYTLGEQLLFDEDQMHEFKQGRNPKRRREQMCEYLCSFLNSGGGVLYFGVNDTGRVVGVPLNRADRDQTLLQFAQDVTQHMLPSLMAVAASDAEPEREIHRQATIAVKMARPRKQTKQERQGQPRQREQKPLFVVEVVARPWCMRGPVRPYSFKGVQLKKVGSSITKMTESDTAAATREENNIHPAKLHTRGGWRQPLKLSQSSASVAESSPPLYEINFVPVLRGSSDPQPTATEGTSSPLPKRQAGAVTQTPASEGCSSLFVGNVNFQTSPAALRAVFEPYHVVDVNIQTKKNGRSKGWAIARFAEPEHAQSAIDGVNGKQVDGRKLRCRPDRGPNSKRT